MKRHRKRIVIVTGLSISVLCLWLAFRKVHWAELWASLRSMSLPILVMSLVLINLHNFVLAKRWHIIVNQLTAVPYWTAFWSLRISFFFNATLPARLGEPFRIFYLHRLCSLSAARGVGAMAADRFIDFVTMLVLLYTAVIVLGVRGIVPPIKMVLLGFVLVVISLLVATRLPHQSHHKWLDRILKIRLHISQGLKPLIHLKSLLPCLALSWLGWCLQGFVVTLIAFGLGEPLSFFKALMVVAGITVAVAIPSSPGNFGTFELGAIAILTYFKVPPTQAASIAIVYHMVQFIPTLLVGAYGYYFRFLHLSPTRQAPGSFSKFESS